MDSYLHLLTYHPTEFLKAVLIGGPILWLLFTGDQPDVVHEHEVDGQDPMKGCGRDGGHGQGQGGGAE